MCYVLIIIRIYRIPSRYLWRYNIIWPTASRRTHVNKTSKPKCLKSKFKVECRTKWWIDAQVFSENNKATSKYFDSLTNFNEKLQNADKPGIIHRENIEWFLISYFLQSYLPFDNIILCILESYVDNHNQIKYLGHKTRIIFSLIILFGKQCLFKYYHLEYEIIKTDLMFNRKSNVHNIMWLRCDIQFRGLWFTIFLSND